MHRFAIAAALILSFTAHISAEELSPAQLRQQIHAALRAESTSTGSQREVAIRRLTELYRAVDTHENLPNASRRQLTAQLRARLKRVEAALAKSLNLPADASTPSPDPQAILAQIQGNPQAAAPVGGPVQNNPGALPANAGGPTANAGGAQGNAFAAQTVANANQLIELIQNTIAPQSWDVRGGLGTIRYFAPAQVLVIRQTGGIHDQVGDAIGQLRANRGQP